MTDGPRPSAADEGASRRSAREEVRRTGPASAPAVPDLPPPGGDFLGLI